MYISIQILKFVNAMKIIRSLENDYPSETPLGGKSRNLWRDFCNFMIDKTPAPPATLSEYDRKVRFYAYLPPIEESRDWLESRYDRP
jgi:hypothetical protein